MAKPGLYDDIVNDSPKKGLYDDIIAEKPTPAKVIAKPAQPTTTVAPRKGVTPGGPTGNLTPVTPEMEARQRQADRLTQERMAADLNWKNHKPGPGASTGTNDAGARASRTDRSQKPKRQTSREIQDDVNRTQDRFTRDVDSFLGYDPAEEERHRKTQGFTPPVGVPQHSALATILGGLAFSPFNLYAEANTLTDSTRPGRERAGAAGNIALTALPAVLKGASAVKTGVEAAQEARGASKAADFAAKERALGHAGGVHEVPPVAQAERQVKPQVKPQGPGFKVNEPLEGLATKKPKPPNPPATTTPGTAATRTESGGSALDVRQPWEKTKAEWLGKPKITTAKYASQLTPSVGANLSVPPEPFMGGKYTIRRLEGRYAVFDGDKPIAVYANGDTLVVDPKYRRQGIGTELVLDYRSRDGSANIASTRTKASQALQVKAHRIAVERAVEQGKPVPPQVLADYPDLVSKSKPSARATEPVPTPEPTRGLARIPEDAQPAKPAPQDVTGVAKQITGRAPLPGTTVQQIAIEGQRALEQGHVNPSSVADRVKQTGAPMTDLELSATGARLRQIRNRQNALLAKNDSEPASAMLGQQEYDQLEGEANHLLGAADISLNKGFHRMGMAAQVAYKPDFSVAALRSRARLANMGEQIPLHIQEQIDSIGRKYQQAQLDLENAKKEFAQQLGDRKQRKLGESQPPAPVAARARQRNIDSVRRYFGAEKGQVPVRGGVGKSRQAGAVSYTLPDSEMDAMKAVRSLAKEQVQNGAGSLDEVMDGIRQSTGLNIPDEHLMRMLSDKYRSHMLEADVAKLRANREMVDLQNSARRRLQPTYKKALTGVMEVFTTTQRSMQAGLDLSAPFIQGRKGLFANPIGWAKAWKPMIEATLKGDEAALTHYANITEHPMYPRAKASGLDLTEPGGRFTAQEEQFAGNLVRRMAESKVPVLKQYAQALERSEFAYTSFLNKLRYDTFTKMASVAPDNPAYLRDIANTINVIYGRGGGEAAKRIGALPGIGNAVYAPRYTLSQFQYAGGQPLLKAETMAGKAQAAKIYASQAVALTGLVKLAEMAGWKVDTDIRSSNFGKAQSPDGKLYDLFAKEGQAYRLLGQVLYGKISAKGNYTPPDKFGAKEQIGMKFLEGKMAPVARNATEALFGKFDPDTGKNRPVTPGDVGMGFVPIWIQQAAQDKTFGTSPTNILGLDTQKGKLSNKRVPLNLGKPGIRSKG